MGEVKDIYLPEGIIAIGEELRLRKNVYNSKLLISLSIKLIKAQV